MSKDRRSEYAEKLKDPRWQRVRLKVLERDGWKCQACGETEITLHVHHKYYENRKEPWDYPLDAFLTLCEICHEEEYQSRKDEEQTLLQALRIKGLLTAEVNNLVCSFYEMPLLRDVREQISAICWALRTPTVLQAVIDAYLDDLRRRERRRQTDPPANASSTGGV